MKTWTIVSVIVRDISRRRAGSKAVTDAGQSEGGAEEEKGEDKEAEKKKKRKRQDYWLWKYN